MEAGSPKHYHRLNPEKLVPRHHPVHFLDRISVEFNFHGRVPLPHNYLSWRAFNEFLDVAFAGLLPSLISPETIRIKFNNNIIPDRRRLIRVNIDKRALFKYRVHAFANNICSVSSLGVRDTYRASYVVHGFPVELEVTIVPSNRNT